MKTVQLEVGNIPNQVFLSIIVRAINELEQEFDKSNNSEALSALQNDDLYIDILSETEVHATYVNQRKMLDATSSIRFNNKEGYITIDGEWRIEYHEYISIDNRKEFEELQEKMLTAHIESLEQYVVTEIKQQLHHYDIATCYPYGFNRVSCINTTTSTIEEIKLSPYYNILNKSKEVTYNCIRRLQKHSLVYNKENNYCIASARDRHDLGPIYQLSSAYIRNVSDSTTWIPICFLTKSSKLPFNKFAYLKDIDNQESDNYMIIYLSAKGIFYNNNTLLATRILIDPENFRTSIKYQTDDAIFAISVSENGELSIEQTDANNNKTTKKYLIEKIVEKENMNSHPELLLFSDKISILSSGIIYDGTEFEPIITTRTKDRLAAEEKDMAFKQEHPILAFLAATWKFLVGIIIFLLFMLMI